MKRRQLYLVLAALGLIVPYYFFLSFLAANGFNGRGFVNELFGTQVSAFFAADLIVSCIVFAGFLRQESMRYSIPHSWIFPVLLVTVGLSFALPLFLYVRESRLQRNSGLNPGGAPVVPVLRP